MLHTIGGTIRRLMLGAAPPNGPSIPPPEPAPEQVAACAHVADAPLSVQRPPRVPPPPLSPAVAARSFVRWMQDWGLEGERPFAGPSGIWEFYLWHCKEHELTPIPDNMFAQALAKLVPKRLVRMRLEGKLERPTYYSIPKAKTPAAVVPPASTCVARRRAAA